MDHCFKRAEISSFWKTNGVAQLVNVKIPSVKLLLQWCAFSGLSADYEARTSDILSNYLKNNVKLILCKWHEWSDYLHLCHVSHRGKQGGIYTRVSEFPVFHINSDPVNRIP